MRGGGARGGGVPVQRNLEIGKEMTPEEQAKVLRDRKWKDSHKASQGNHNRKRGAMKKMMRGMGGGFPG